MEVGATEKINFFIGLTFKSSLKHWLIIVLLQMGVYVHYSFSNWMHNEEIDEEIFSSFLSFRNFWKIIKSFELKLETFSNKFIASMIIKLNLNYCFYRKWFRDMTKRIFKIDDKFLPFSLFYHSMCQKRPGR